MSNADQIEFWNGSVGRTWADMQDRMDAAFTSVTAALLSLAAPQPGEHVLDIGCGSGETTLALAAAVGDDGAALGLDISAPLLARAQARAEELLSDAEFREADAASFDDGDRYQLLISRFGVMFFDDPKAAFANLHHLAAPGGRLAFACWQGPAHNPWVGIPAGAVGDVLPPQPPADPLAPGPFAFADAGRVAAILAAAGWRDIVFHALPFIMVTGSGDDPVAAAVHFVMRIGPTARLIRDAGPEVDAVVRERLTAALRPYAANGAVGLPANAWLVAARA